MALRAGSMTLRMGPSGKSLAPPAQRVLCSSPYGSSSSFFFCHMQKGPRRRFGGVFVVVRPAWAHSYGWKSGHKQVTASEEKRNCMRATECGKEAWIAAAGR
jgi:hypothetical protein